MTGVLMAVDGNSLLHRSFHALAGGGARSTTGEPIWAIRGLLTQLVAAADRIEPTAIVVGFDDPDHSYRRQRCPEYKAQRGDKLPTLVQQLRRAVAVVAELGLRVVVPPGLEADDVLASAARQANRSGGRCVVVTSDRDAFALIDERTSVLRVINGGVDASPLMTPDRLELLLGVRPGQYRDFAALRGDASDNLPGVRGIGPKRAAALLGRLGTGESIFADAAAGGREIAAAIGSRWSATLAEPAARARWSHNRAMMELRCDVDLSLETGSGLPLPADTVRRVLLAHGLPATAKLAERALAHQEHETSTEVDSLGWDPRAQWQTRRLLPPLPVSLQPTLF